MKELTIRIIVAVFGIPVFAFAVLKGELYFFVLVVLMSGIGQWEMYDLLQKKEAIAQRIPGILVGFILLYTVYFGMNIWAVISIAALLLIIFSKEMFLNQGSANLNSSATFIAVIYPTLFLSSLLYLRENVSFMIP